MEGERNPTAPHSFRYWLIRTALREKVSLERKQFPSWFSPCTPTSNPFRAR